MDGQKASADGASLVLYLQQGQGRSLRDLGGRREPPGEVIGRLIYGTQVQEFTRASGTVTLLKVASNFGNSNISLCCEGTDRAPKTTVRTWRPPTTTHLVKPTEHINRVRGIPKITIFRGGQGFPKSQQLASIDP